MKIAKYSLFATFFISTISFADTPIQEQVTLPSIIDVISFCSSDKNCISIVPVIKERELNYDVKYETDPIATDPTTEDPDD
ncbi:MAG: hypothetical protein HRT54_14255 [Colwellia sp.]|nr:hypothetical protein [Colwellia sp.]